GVGPDAAAVAAGAHRRRAAVGRRCLVRGRRGPPIAPLQGRPGEQGRHHGPRPVGVDQTSQLLWRRLRVVGAVAGRHRGVGFVAAGAISGADAVLPRLRDRRKTHREIHAESARLRRIPFAHIIFRPDSTQIAITVTILAPVARLPLVSTDLDALLRQVASRDVDAFATFYDHTRARVFGLVTRVLRDPGYSEETTEDMWLEVWGTAESYDPSAGSPLAWLMTLAHRRAVDRVRSEQAASQRESRYGAANVDPPSDQVADSVILRDERRQVADCLDSLTDAQRECIQLAYYDGLTYA